MSRLTSFELLRIIACFLIIGIHCLPPLHTETGNFILFMQALVRVSLPLFFLISGYFSLNQKIESIMRWYISRLLKLFVPFFIYALIHYLVKDLDEDFFSLFFFKPLSISSHFWFIHMFAGLIILAPAFNAMIISLSSRLALRSLTILLIVHAMASNSNLVNLNFGLIRLYDMPPFGTWLLYFVCGGLLAKCQNLINLRSAYIMASVGLLLTFFMSLYVKVELNLYDNNISMFLYAIGILLIFSKIQYTFSTKQNRIILYLATNTYGVYLIHQLVLRNIENYPIIFKWPITFLGAFALAIIVNTVVSYCTSKMKQLH